MATLQFTAFSEQSENATDERERLILEHLSQVRWIATRMHERLPNSTTLEDLISIGIVGLINAVDNFDPSHNAKLKTYAEYKIRGAILDSVRGSDGVPTNKRKRIREVQCAMEVLEQRLQRTPSEEEIATELGLTLEVYWEWLLELRGISVGSLDAAASKDDSRSLMYFLADREDQSPGHLLERSELQKVIEEGLRKMPKMEGMVLDLYYHQELGIREISVILSIHVTRVSQIKSQAILRLRSYIEQQWPSSKGGRR
jgi:RNA polymerase sigma factor for flagellar operon FliA